MREVLTNIVVAIILQYRSGSNEQVVHLKAMQCYRSAVSQ